MQAKCRYYADMSKRFDDATARRVGFRIESADIVPSYSHTRSVSRAMRSRERNARFCLKCRQNADTMQTCPSASTMPLLDVSQLVRCAIRALYRNIWPGK